MASVTDEAIINRLATEFDSIAGVETAFPFAKNPDTLSNVQLPAVLFIPVSFEAQAKGHHNIHQSELNVAAILFVSERQAQGGALKFLENDAIPFLFKTRKHFQTDAVIRRLLGLGLTNAAIISGQYGAGGPLLTHSGIEYLGCIFRFKLIEVQ